MPTQDEVFTSIVQCVRRGAGMDLGDDAVAALRARYFTWIVTPGEREGEKVETPQQVWEEAPGRRLQRQFERIGRQAATKSKATRKARLSETETIEEAVVAESEGDCPWCRPPG